MKVVVKRRIRVGGKEYDKVEDLPAELRAAYERALAASAGAPNGGILATTEDGSGTSGGGALPGARATARIQISFGGREYAGVYEMPPKVRKLYEGVMAVVGSADGGGRLDAAGPGSSPDDAGPGASHTGITLGAHGSQIATGEPIPEIHPALQPGARGNTEGPTADRSLLPRPITWLLLGIAMLLASWALARLFAQH